MVKWNLIHDPPTYPRPLSGNERVGQADRKTKRRASATKRKIILAVLFGYTSLDFDTPNGAAQGRKKREETEQSSFPQRDRIPLVE